MFLKALLAFLALPGIFGFLVPSVLGAMDPWRTGPHSGGIGILGIGTIVLLWCIRDFYVSGKGTLAPWAPPKHLVVVGLYRHTRNPMYLGVVIIVAGIASLFGSPFVVIYLAGMALSFHGRVVRSEEPWLADQFGSEWEAYSKGVSRWIPRLRPWHKDKK